MHLAKTGLVLFVFLIAADVSYSQARKSSITRKSPISSRFRAPIVSKSKARIMCPIFEKSQYPYQGIGLKLGDPFALTYKYYPNKHWALAVDAGKAASGLYNKYYRSVYSSYLPDTLENVESIQYLTHIAQSDWLFETKFLYQWDAGKLSKGLQFYAGVGLQWRSTVLEYDYLFEDEAIDESRFGKFTQKRFTYCATLQSDHQSAGGFGTCWQTSLSYPGRHVL